MKERFSKVIATVIVAAVPFTADARQWSLQDCIDYALQNNINIQKNHLQKLSANEDLLQSKAELLPSLSASTSHSVQYTPWVESGVSADGYQKVSVDKVSYNGSYGVNASWTVWNGNRNQNQIKLNKLIAQQADLDSTTTAQTIQEQIAQLYVQILYSSEAVNVNKESLEMSRMNEDRGKEVLRVGKMSKADLAQLTAQRAQDEYNVVAAESQVRNYKRQLKELLQITNDEDFDVTIPAATDAMALQQIPALQSVYSSALDYRPEIKSYQNAIDQSSLNIKIAKASNLPTVGFNAGVNTSTTTMNSLTWGKQMKDNFALGGGFTVSIPIFDNRSKKTAVNKALIQRDNAILDLKNEQTNLYSTIENYWLQATTEQNQFKAAKASTESAKTSYQLLSEQFALGLKNIVELRTGKDNLITAEQNELQAKYLAILNIKMLEFYKNGKIN